MIFSLRMEEVSQQQQSETHNIPWRLESWERSQRNQRQGIFAEIVYIDKHKLYGWERHLMQNTARCQVHFCGFPYSVYVV